MPANITFAGGDVVKERFHMLLPWIIKVGSSANYGDRNGTSTCKDVASVFLNNLSRTKFYGPREPKQGPIKALIIHREAKGDQK